MFEKNPKLKSIFLINFLLSLSVALTAYITSSFLSFFVGEKLVGLIYVLGSALSVVALLAAPKIFGRMGGQKFLLCISSISVFLLILLAFAQSTWVAVLAFTLYFAFNLLIVFSLDEILKIFSQNSEIGKIRGLYFAIGSSAWIVSQLMFFTVLGNSPLRIIYLLASLIILLSFLVSFFTLKNIPDPKYDKSDIIKNTKEFFKNKNLFRSYGINFLLQFFYSWMVIYTPIYLSAHLGFSWAKIGIIFAIMLIPFSILPFPLGKYADKIGERKLLMLGFLVASAATVSLFFIGRHEVWIWALALFATRVGAATIESMSDVYFFKHIRPENEEFIGVYRSAAPVAYIIGPAVALFVLSIVPTFNYIYIVLGAFLLAGVFLAERIERSDI